jgi:glycosyltransferase involved in cell wall biosynthesis
LLRKKEAVINFSFCLPTRNCGFALNNTISSIVKSCRHAKEKKYEIIIVDNHSNDDTKEVVKKWAKKYRQIHYFKNQKNIEAPRNIIKTLSQASGKYCWLIGDDVISLASLSLVKKQIKRQRDEPSVISLSWASKWGDNYSGKREVRDLENRKKIKYSCSTNGLHDYLELRLPTFGFMSALIFNRKFLDLNFVNKNNLNDSRWIQCHLLFRALQLNPFAIHIKPICVIDDHAKENHRKVPKEPWPSGIFCKHFNQLVENPLYRELLPDPTKNEVFSSFYDYVYCDRFSFRGIKGIIRFARPETSDRQLFWITYALLKNSYGWFRALNRISPKLGSLITKAVQRV